MSLEVIQLLHWVSGRDVGPCPDCVCAAQCASGCSPEDVMEGHIASTVQSLHLVAHVFKEQLVLVQVHLQPAPEQTKQELHPGRGYHPLEGQLYKSKGFPWTMLRLRSGLYIFMSVSVKCT